MRTHAKSAKLCYTPQIVRVFDKLFDSMNGASTNHKYTKGKKLRRAVTIDTDHHIARNCELARTCQIQLLGKIKFKDNVGNTVSVPTLKSCITTVKSIMRLWQFFHARGIEIMRPRYFNSDPIENFFGQTRAYNFRYNDPDCHSFTCTYRSLLITRLITFHNKDFNCEDDQGKQLLNLAQVLNLAKSNTHIKTHMMKMT